MLPEKIGNYKVNRLIGEGGMAKVYEVQNTLGKRFAAKVLLPKYQLDDQIQKRFIQEAQVMVKLKHKNICQIIDLIETSDQSFIIMEYLNGMDLKSYIDKNGKASEAEVMEWLKQIAPALDYAHNKGIVHRDIKPSNLFLCKDGTIKLMDFGIAKVSQDSLVSTHTLSKMGSPIYMSPEQIKSPKYVDHRTDIYSLGVTLHHLLSGKPPYDEKTESAFEIQMKIVQEPLPKIKALSANLNYVLKKATEKIVENRYENVSQILKSPKLKDVTVKKTKSNEKTEDATIVEKPKERKSSTTRSKIKKTIPKKLRIINSDFDYSDNSFKLTVKGDKVKISNKLYSVFINSGYCLERGTKLNGTYEKGNESKHYWTSGIAMYHVFLVNSTTQSEFEYFLLIKNQGQHRSAARDGGLIGHQINKRRFAKESERLFYELKYAFSE
jgi:serine/threonine protein kinase